jgi:hypothetical protein
MLKKFYVRICRRRWGLSLSALAWLRAKEGRPWFRDRIDGWWLLFFSDHNHCQSSYQRERGDRRKSTDTD